MPARDGAGERRAAAVSSGRGVLLARREFGESGKLPSLRLPAMQSAPTRRVAFAALGLLICMFLAGCGAAGGTSRFALPLDLPPGVAGAVPVRVASVAMEADAAILDPVQVQPWGAFSADDLRNIERSLADTVSSNAGSAARSAAKPGFDLHVVVRRYVVTTSNTAGAVLACVAWTATGPDGAPAYAEQFYAWDTGYLVTTLGRIKDAVHEAIVRRVATKALVLAAGDAAGLAERGFERTSTSFDDAVARLPRTMVSLGDDSLAFFPGRAVGAVRLLTSSGVSSVEWNVGAPSGAFDWTGYLSRVRRPSSR